MKTALLAAIGAAAVTIASPALAQDEASSFNGPYVGVLGGYDNVGLNSSREDGVLYGGVIGYDINLGGAVRSEEHTSELQSLMRISYAVFCLKKKQKKVRYNKVA